MTVAVLIFALSFVGIVSLFLLKQWETATSRILFPHIRTQADERALDLKAWLIRLRGELDKLPPVLLHLTHVAVHEIALGIAAFARYSEEQMHRLADFVSHKRGFQRRESHNEFLKRITEHPMRDSRAMKRDEETQENSDSPKEGESL